MEKNNIWTRLEPLLSWYLPQLQALPVFLFFGLFVVIPIAFIVLRSFFTSVAGKVELPLTLTAYSQLITTGRLPILEQGFVTAAIVTLLSVVMAFPVAYYIAFGIDPKYKGFASYILILPFLTSYIVRTFSWRLILGRTGPVNTILLAIGLTKQPVEGILYSEYSVVVGLLSAYLPFMIFTLFLAMSRIEKSIFDASADLGASPLHTTLHLVLPLSAPGIYAGSLMIFAIVLGDNIAVPFVGEPMSLSITMMLYNIMGTLNWPLSFAVSTVLLCVMLLGILIVNRVADFAQLFRSIYR